MEDEVSHPRKTMDKFFLLRRRLISGLGGRIILKQILEEKDGVE
jgi:hypothetical protein